jgi:DNA-binding XRE family transcriptional regulator
MPTETDFDEIDAIRRCRDALRSGRYRELRKRFGLSQTTVADAIGVGKPALSQYERGHRLPRGEVALKYGRFMDELERRLSETDS